MQAVQPTLIAGPAGGTGATVAFAGGRPSGTNAGQVAVTTGTSPVSGLLCTVQFYFPLTANPFVVLFPASPATAAVANYISTFVGTIFNFEIWTSEALAANTTYYWTYHVDE
jgi:hypothetical protein